MDVESLIKLLEDSQNSLLESAAKDFADWSKLKHNKESLEFFLRHNIAVIYSENAAGGERQEVLVSSNPAYLGFLNGLRSKNNKNRIVKLISASPKFQKILKSSNRNIVRTWNLVENRKFEIPMDGVWAIRRWLALDESNIQILSEETNKILAKGRAASK